MKKEEKLIEKFSTSKMIGAIFLALVILIGAQIWSTLISVIPFNFGVSGVICNIIAGVLYVLFALMGSALFCKKFLKISMTEMRIPRVQIKVIWVIAGILMPVFVLLSFLLVDGHWEINTFDTTTTWGIITSAVIFVGLATGIVEEMIFRGLIMGCLEKRFSIKIAIIVPSVLFAALHIVGSDLDFISFLQLLVAGTIVGILFSLIAYESNSIWNSAIVHGIWNMAIIGGILHIGNTKDDSSIFNYVIENKSALLSGGDFGVEASVISIVVYAIFIVMAIVLFQRKIRTVK